MQSSLSRNQHRDDIRMSLEWCNHIDGMTIFPKLPIHIRVYRKKWERNRSVAKCVREAKSGSDKLRELNDAIQPAELEQQAPYPAGIEQPTLQARNNNSHSIVGGTLVGECPSGGLSHTKKTRGADRSKPTGEKRKRECTNCEILVVNIYTIARGVVVRSGVIIWTSRVLKDVTSAVLEDERR